jgi:type I restriction enzyme S subunit
MTKLNLGKHEQYKNVDHSDLVEIPSHWNEMRLKDLAVLERGKFTHRPRNDPQMYDGVHPFIQTGDVARAIKYVTGYKQTLSDKGIEVSKRFRKGTLVMTIAANIGDVAIIDFDSYFPDSIVGFQPRKSNVDFLFYLFSATKTELNRIKVTNTQDNLNLERLNSLVKFIPPIEEQHAIANYLDAKTAQIDRNIELLEGKAEKYADLKQSLINETVTHGLDKTVPMKDSGVEWIGAVPAHWEVKQLKQFATMRGRIGWQGLKNSEFTDEVNSPFLITGMNFKDGKIRWNEVYHISIERYEQAPEIQLKNNDILMTKDGTIGKLLFIENIPLPHKASLNSHLLVIRPIKNSYFPKFMFHQLNSLPFQHYTELTKSGTTFFGISQEAVERYIAVLPPTEEQKVIAEYLDAKTAHIEKIIETINLQIKNFKELRKTLINDVVTGKIKVYEG